MSLQPMDNDDVDEINGVATQPASARESQPTTPGKEKETNSRGSTVANNPFTVAADLSRISEDDRLRSSDYHTNTQVI